MYPGSFFQATHDHFWNPDAPRTPFDARMCIHQLGHAIGNREVSILPKMSIHRAEWLYFEGGPQDCWSETRIMDNKPLLLEPWAMSRARILVASDWYRATVAAWELGVTPPRLPYEGG